MMKIKQSVLFYFICLGVLSTALNLTNGTFPTDQEFDVPTSANRPDDDGENGSFYTIDALLVAGGVSTLKIGQNETGLSVRLTARDGTVSAWHRLLDSEEVNSFGQRRYVLPGTTRDLGVISSVAIRVDKPELAASSMPYYVCVHTTNTNTTLGGDRWNGCAYMQPPVGSKNGADQQYPLRDANGTLF